MEWTVAEERNKQTPETYTMEIINVINIENPN